MTRCATRISTLAMLALQVACGGGYSAAPSTPSSSQGSAGSLSATVHITATGVSPKEVRIGAGGQVTFVNDDTRSHEMMSDPHPTHNGCPEINQVGSINPGQSRATATFMESRTCGFHDNRQDGVDALRGTIVVGQGGDPTPRY